MVNSLIAKEDLDSEMTVVRNEMESGEQPVPHPDAEDAGGRVPVAQLRQEHHRARSDVENVDIGQLRAFYHQYYQPDNAVLIVAGKFDPQATLADIEETLGKLPAPNARYRASTRWNRCRTANAR